MDLQFYIWYYCVICWLAASYVASTKWRELSKKYPDKNLYLLSLILTVVFAPIWLLIGLPIGIMKLIVKGIGWVIK